MEELKKARFFHFGGKMTTSVTVKLVCPNYTKSTAHYILLYIHTYIYYY